MDVEKTYKLSGSICSPEELYGGRVLPSDLIVTAQNTEHMFPTRTIGRGDAHAPEYAPYRENLRDFSALEVKTKDQTYDLYDYVTRNHVVGLMIVEGGDTLFERYEYGVTAQTRWMSMSMAKSVSTTLVGVAVQDGYISNIDDPIIDYIPRLKGGAYDGVTIRQVMQMTSGVDWDDTQVNPESDRRHMLRLQMELKPGAIVDYLKSRPRIAEPGLRWNYSTGETHLVGALVQEATGKWLSDYLSEKIWSRIGMKSDAAWWLEARDGLEVGGSGICATLHDYVRFCDFMMRGGVIDGERVLPETWLHDATQDFLPAEAGHHYGFMWWPVPSRNGEFAHRAFSARGIFGQYVYVNPARSLLIGVISARAKPRFSEVILDNDFFNSVVEFLA